jgi:acyl-CoA reductase-like NAD-dependent aldehyde dehydrogenase
LTGVLAEARGEKPVNSNPSVQEMLARLEEQIAHNAEREAFHAAREAFHRDQRSSHAEELERLTRCRDSLQAATETAKGLMAHGVPKTPAPAPLEVPDMGRRFRLARLVEQVVEKKAPRERFGPKAVAAEVNQAFGGNLKRRFSERQVSAALAWLAKGGHLVRVEQGRPFHESQYTRSE